MFNRLPEFPSILEKGIKKELKDKGISTKVSVEIIYGTFMYRIKVATRQFAEMPYKEIHEYLWNIVKQLLSPDDQLSICSIEIER